VDDRELQNMISRLDYLEGKISSIENLLGFNHSGIDSIKSRLEFLESYSIVNDHHEFDSLFTNDKILSSGNLFRSYLKKKLEKMREIVSLPPNITRVRKDPNEVYNFDKFQPYDKIEKLFHQSQLLLLFAAPSLSSEFQMKLLHLIHHLRGCYVVVPGIIEWNLKSNTEHLEYIKENFHSIVNELDSHNLTLI